MLLQSQFVFVYAFFNKVFFYAFDQSIYFLNNKFSNPLFK